MRRRSSSSCAAKANTRFASCCGRSRTAARSSRSPGSRIDRDGRFVHNPESSRRRAEVDRRSGSPDRSARVLSGYTLLGRQADVVETSRGCTYDCSFCSIIEMRGRNFHPLFDRSRAGRHRRRPAARRAGDLPGRRQHHARRAPVRNAVSGDRRQRLHRHRLHRAGDDVTDRRARRATGAAHAARGIPLCVPRHRERARGGSRVPEGRRQEHASPRRPGRSATRRSRRSSICIGTGCTSSAV